jgi:transposase
MRRFALREENEALALREEGTIVTPARNRVTPMGEIEAIPLRGAWTGNRGILHAGRETVRFPRALWGAKGHRSSLKQRVHALLLAHAKPCPVSDLFGIAGRGLLERLELPEPWQGHIQASLRLIDELDQEIEACERELRRLGADHRYVPLLMTVPGIGWVLAYTIAAEIGDISRFANPRKLAGYTGLFPRVYQSGDSDRRGSLSKQGPRYLRWALVEAATHACTHPAYRDRYQRTKTRLGKQRGAKIAQVDLARTLTEAIWYMLTRNQPFAPANATDPLAVAPVSPCNWFFC